MHEALLRFKGTIDLQIDLARRDDPEGRAYKKHAIEKQMNLLQQRVKPSPKRMAAKPQMIWRQQKLPETTMRMLRRTPETTTRMPRKMQEIKTTTPRLKKPSRKILTNLRCVTHLSNTQNAASGNAADEIKGRRKLIHVLSAGNRRSSY